MEITYAALFHHVLACTGGAAGGGGTDRWLESRAGAMCKQQGAGSWRRGGRFDE